MGSNSALLQQLPETKKIASVKFQWENIWHRRTALKCLALIKLLNSVRVLDARIAEWYHNRLWPSVHGDMPWAMSSSLSDGKLFLDPSTTSKLYSWFYLVCLIWYYYLSVKFVMWIVKQKIENKRNLFKKTSLRSQQKIIYWNDLTNKLQVRQTKGR